MGNLFKKNKREEPGLRGAATVENEDPIQNLENIDIVGKRNDGGVDLVLVVSRKLLCSDEHLQLLQTKMQNYLSIINCDEFIRDFGNPSPERTAIKIVCVVPPDPGILDVIKQMEPTVRENNASVKVEIQRG